MAVSTKTFSDFSAFQDVGSFTPSTMATPAISGGLLIARADNVVYAIGEKS